MTASSISFATGERGTASAQPAADRAADGAAAGGSGEAALAKRWYLGLVLAAPTRLLLHEERHISNRLALSASPTPIICILLQGGLCSGAGGSSRRLWRGPSLGGEAAVGRQTGACHHDHHEQSTITYSKCRQSSNIARGSAHAFGVDRAWLVKPLLDGKQVCAITLTKRHLL